MKVNIDLNQENFISFQNFIGSIDLTANPMINSLVPGQWKGQVVPSVYLQVNDAIALDVEVKVQNKNKVKYVNPDVDDVVETVTYSGICLDIITYKNRIGLNFVIPNDPYVKNYRVVNSYIYPFLFIKRNMVIGYERKGSVNFYAVKYKKSLVLEDNSSASFYAGARGGLVGYFMYKGLTSAMKGIVKKMEDETMKKSGSLFTMKYWEGDKEMNIGIVCEDFYAEAFNSFLSNHWIKGEPIHIPPARKKEGCFIATMVYGAYDHPKVILLREFRDNYLKRFLLGCAFIRVYYYFSPKAVTLFRKNKRIIKIVRNCLDYIINRVLKK